MKKIDLNKFNLKCDNKIKPVYAKRYAEDGSEYLEKIDEINIEEDLKEKQLEIERILEIINTQKRLKAEELVDNFDEIDLQNMEELTKLNDIDTFEFLNKTEELKELYNKFPEDIKQKYNNISKFGKEFLPNFIKEQQEKLQQNKLQEEKLQKIDNKEETIAKLQNQLNELQNQINNKGAEENVQ